MNTKNQTANQDGKEDGEELPVDDLTRLFTKKTLTREDRETAIAQIAEIENQNVLRRGLPFLYGWKWYSWAKEFFDSRNKITLLCAGNQLSKSSSQIRKIIHWATEKELWEELWPGESDPNQFWYFYPSQDVVNAEFYAKWKQFLPCNGFEDDPKYGWKPIIKRGDILGITFNSGVIMYFKTYGQRASNLQTGTIFYVAVDEEMPLHLFDELMLRINAVNGYFSMVFTATLGQDEWRRAMDPGAEEIEFLPQALKITASAYDSMRYIDGTPSKWTIARIKQAEARCSSPAEILKRIYGKFILTSERKYGSFDPKRHIAKGHQMPASWSIYAGVDPGTGGEKNHPAAICFIAVSPDYTQGRVLYVWRGDGITTTAGSVYSKYLEIVSNKNYKVARKFYDHAAKDFDIISGHTFEKAEKGHERGEEIINTLFETDAMILYDDLHDEDNEVGKLKAELLTIRKAAVGKSGQKDDASDAFRYASTKVPWDFTAIKAKWEKPPQDPDLGKSPEQLDLEARRKAFEGDGSRDEDDIMDEFKEWNDAYG